MIWIVDDDEEMSRAVGLMLKLLDCEATSFFNVRSAVQTLLTGKTPDLIILDINMPEVSGLDMVEFLRAQPRMEEHSHRHAFLRSSADAIVDKALAVGCGFIYNETRDHRRT